MKTVYIIAPYTKGDVAINVARAIHFCNEIIDAGFAPFNPLLFHFQHLVHPYDYKTWMNIDKEWLRRSDIVIRIEGESKGGDLEEKLARKLKKSIFHVNENNIGQKLNLILREEC